MGDLNKFFNPKTIALIGATKNKNNVGYTITKKLKKFKGKIIFVNNKEEKILNKKIYKKITDCKNKIDLAIIITPKRALFKLLKEVNKKQIKNIILISQNFENKKSIKLKNKINSFVKQNSINLLGPNSFGLIHEKNNLDLTPLKISPKKGKTVFISQRGSLISFLLDFNIPLRAFVDIGNQTNLNFSDFLEYFSKDKQTNKIILYIEELKEGKRFIEIAKKSKKKIIIVKGARTKKRKNTIKNTPSNLEIYLGAFKQAKVKYSSSLSSAFDIRKESIIKSLKGKKIAILTNSKGAGNLLTDELIENNFRVFGPKNLKTIAKAKDYKKILERTTKNYDNVVVIFIPQLIEEATEIAKVIVHSKIKDKIIAFFLGKDSVKDSIEILKAHNIPVYTNSI